MNLKEVIDPKTALAEVTRFADLKNVFPRRWEQLQPNIEVLAEAVQYGFVSIDEKGAVVQKLVEPVNSITEMNYAARVPAATLQKMYKGLKLDNAVTRMAVVLKAYTGLTETELDALENNDRYIAENIALFL